MSNAPPPNLPQVTYATPYELIFAPIDALESPTVGIPSRYYDRSSVRSSDYTTSEAEIRDADRMHGVRPMSPPPRDEVSELLIPKNCS